MNSTRPKIFGKRGGNQWVMSVGNKDAHGSDDPLAFDTLMEARAFMRKTASQMFAATAQPMKSWSWGTAAILIKDGDDLKPYSSFDLPTVMLTTYSTDGVDYWEEWRFRLPNEYSDGRYLIYSRTSNNRSREHQITFSIGNAKSKRNTHVVFQSVSKSDCITAAKAGRIPRVSGLLNPFCPLQGLRFSMFGPPLGLDYWAMIANNAVVVDDLPDHLLSQHTNLNRMAYVDSHDEATRKMLHRMNTQAILYEIIPSYDLENHMKPVLDGACLLVNAAVLNTGTVVLDYSEPDRFITRVDRERILIFLKFVVDNQLSWAVDGLKFYLENTEQAVLWKVISP